MMNLACSLLRLVWDNIFYFIIFKGLEKDMINIVKFFLHACLQLKLFRMIAMLNIG